MHTVDIIIIYILKILLFINFDYKIVADRLNLDVSYNFDYDK